MASGVPSPTQKDQHVSHPQPRAKQSQDSCWDQRVTVVVDLNYTKSFPSDICTICNTVRYYNARVSSDFPHKETCQYQGTDYFTGYIIGPTNSLLKYEEIYDSAMEKMSSFPEGTTTFEMGPYSRRDLDW